ncbi:hypothetical protein [Streptomyces sp. STCH 565 A]|uniref:hypothetical protein n=1 Tax=Streptomyces sp. STCH 565 A TaxID=2950532 RepID=UPI002075C694|nr:hypothetical protein [Streptomyces sp. STCH 565 A]MCM8548936.1 hypothetical protein [Streptomyces sp. STCH 565 A]
MIVADALDVLWSLGWAVLAWLLFFSAVVTGLIFGTAALALWVWQRIRRPDHRGDYEEAA